MKIYISILVSIVLITACSENKTNSYTFKWAAIDTREIENKLQGMSKQLNPYPKHYDKDNNRIRKDKNIISTQLSDLERIARKKCPLDNTTQKQNYRRNLYDPECYAKTEEAARIEELKHKLNQLEDIVSLQRDHDKKIRDIALKATKNIIADYAKENFDLVVDINRNKIPYNKNGLSLNITDAVLNLIDSSQLNLQLEVNTKKSRLIENKISPQTK